MLSQYSPGKTTIPIQIYPMFESHASVFQTLTFLLWGKKHELLYLHI